MLPQDLPRLKTLITYLRGELRRAEQALAAAEQRQAATARQQPAPEPPAWLVERGLTGRLPARLHLGGCRDAGKHSAPATGEQVRRLLAEGVPACIHLPPGHGPRSARMNGYRHGEGMSPDLRVIVYPPDAEGGRRGRVYGEILRRAHGPGP